MYKVIGGLYGEKDATKQFKEKRKAFAVNDGDTAYTDFYILLYTYGRTCDSF